MNGQVTYFSEVFEDTPKSAKLSNNIYNKYSEYLDSLSSDKIVCLFNIIIDGLIFSSFFSILYIMLSENIINKISFLEKYPKILKLLKDDTLWQVGLKIISYDLLGFIIKKNE